MKQKANRILILVFLLIPAFGRAATYYISTTGSDTTGAGTNASPWANFTRAYSAMAGGDTLIVKDGTYTNQTVISQYDGERPPSGSDGHYTTVQAETDGGVVVDGQGTSSPISMAGYPQSPMRYITIRGFVFRRQATGASLFSIDHMKFIRNGFEDSCDGNCATFSISGRNPNDWSLLESQYILLEECYAWGSGRYKFLVYHVGHTIFRRTVTRNDRSNGNDVTGSYSFYHSDTIECQNCIDIDGDHIEFLVNSAYYGGSFLIPSTDGPSTNINVTGSIALNVDAQFGTLSKDLNNINYSNSVGWHIREGTWARDSATYAHMTFGDLYGPAIATVDDGSGVGLRFSPGDDPVNATAIRNSVLYNIKGAALNSWSTEDYNVFYANNANRTGGTPTGAHSANANPNLRYITRIESDNTTLKGKASDGGDIGATILKRIGVSGSLWGDPGYNTVTAVDLWPFPYEDVIRRDMRSYSYTGPTAAALYGAPTGPVQTLSGARGFCANGQTLTKYIWEYLGNPNPLPSGPGEPDATPPSAPGTVSVSGITGTGFRLNWTASTDNVGVVGYVVTLSTSANLSSPVPGYANKDIGNVLTATISGLSIGNAYYISVKAYDAEGNSSAESRATVTTITSSSASGILDGVRAYPNPWRSDRHAASSGVTFDRLPAGSQVKLFTLSGRWAATLNETNQQAVWNLTNDNGKQVASGIYIYLVTDPQGNTKRGKLVVIR
ncbi:MAG: fibronectin type III domain-containing protein [Elusimicrobiota bacterium]